jgi:hypothetical protein
VNTSASPEAHAAANGKAPVAETYELVNLCSACADDFTARKKAKLDARALRESWWGRIGLGVCFVGMMLLVRQPWHYSILLAWILDRLRMLGPAVLLMGLVFLGEYLVGLQPLRFHRRIRIPWQIIIAATMLWGIHHTHTFQQLVNWLGRRRSSNVVAAVRADEHGSSVETREAFPFPQLEKAEKS